MFFVVSEGRLSLWRQVCFHGHHYSVHNENHLPVDNRPLRLYIYRPQGHYMSSATKDSSQCFSPLCTQSDAISHVPVRWKMDEKTWSFTVPPFTSNKQSKCKESQIFLSIVIKLLIIFFDTPANLKIFFVQTENIWDWVCFFPSLCC